MNYVRLSYTFLWVWTLFCPFADSVCGTCDENLFEVFVL
jgi:hypothetical protein